MNRREKTGMNKNYWKVMVKTEPFRERRGASVNFEK